MSVVDDLLEVLTPEIIGALDVDDLRALETVLHEAVHIPGRRPLQPHQLPPPEFVSGEAFAWGFFAGRFAGKTMTMSDNFYEHMMGPACDPFEPGGHRAAIVGPTQGDVLTSCYAGPSGLYRIDRRIRTVSIDSAKFIRFPNGALAKVVGGNTKDQADRLRAHGNLCRLWIEEAAAIKVLSLIWAQAQFAVRHGRRPQVQISSTPKKTTGFKTVYKSPEVVITHASTRDNVHASAREKARMYRAFEGTRVGAQELDGRLLEDVAGAHWTQDVIDERRVLRHELSARHGIREGEPWELYVRRVLGLTTVYVGVDPGTSGRGDRTGIVVAGGTNPRRHPDGLRQGWILEDRTAMMVPSTVDFGDALGDDQLDPSIDGWAAVATEVAMRWQADAIVVERNRLGRTARAVLRAAGHNYTIIERDAKGSKSNRADSLRQVWRSRCWILGSWPILEEDMTSWVPAEGDDPEWDEESGLDPSEFTGSPDALDAAGHAMIELLGLEKPRGAPVTRSRSLADRMAAGYGRP